MNPNLRRETMCHECPVADQLTSGSIITTPNGENLLMRGVLDHDSNRISELYKSLSEDDRESRFLKSKTTDEAVEQGLISSSTASPDFVYDIVITNVNGEVLAHGGLVIENEIPEIFCVVKNSHRNIGLGSRLVNDLMTAAVAAGYSNIVATTLFDNDSMTHILQPIGESHPRCDCIAWELELDSPEIRPVMCGLDGLARYCASVN